MPPSLFALVELAPRDPILGLTEAYNADPRTDKVNLGVGVYTDDAGRVPLLEAVRVAEERRLAATPSRGYQPIDGLVAYNQAVQGLLFGSGAGLVADGRSVTLEALGGTGALRIGADFLRRAFPEAGVYISDPSWENHRALFEAAGFPVGTYAYYDPATRGVDTAAMGASLRALPAGSIVVLHACCHNPTGADLAADDWREVVEIVRERGLVAFIDMAYQGFADGIAEDAIALDLFTASGLDFLVSSSFSKSFSLYGERVGALTIVTADRDESARVLSQVKRVVRTNYSSPPTHGGAIVATVLADPHLRATWERELGGMRDRIRAMREGLVARLAEHAPGRDFSFITRQRGMFSYTGLTPEEVDALRDDHGVFAVRSGRICLAAVNSRNVDHVAASIAAVVA